MYWKKADATANEGTYHTPSGKALNIETTAYGLLALSEMGRRDQGLLALKWLTSQRNPSGGFASTQVGIHFMTG